MTEADRLTGRIRRYANVSVGMGGLAARLMGDILFGADEAGGRAADLARTLGNLKGPLMKAAQLMSTIPDALPKDYAAELSQLQSQAPPMGWPFVRRRMASELGPEWQSRFAYFEREAAAAASLGQVHRARAQEGGPLLACKLQYPDMQSTVEADLAQLRMVLGLYRRIDGAIDPSQVLIEIGARLREELDYERERRHMALFHDILAGESDISVPDPVPDLSTRRLLTMTWLEGARLLDFRDRPLETRNRIARSLFRAWWLPFARYGVIHGDPHLGNYTIATDLTLNLLDFGCVRLFEPEFVQGVIDLYHALERQDMELARHAYETWGFQDISNELMETLNIWAGFILGPLLDRRTRRIAEATSPADYGRETAMKVRRRLKEIGTVTPPRHFVFMDRAAIGLGAVFIHLAAELDWAALFHSAIDNFGIDALSARQADAFRAAGLERPVETHEPG